MKKILKLLGLTLILSQPIQSQFTGTLHHENEFLPGATEHTLLHYVIDQADYVNGGLTFTYPVGWFSSIPYVTASISLLGAFDPTTNYIPVVETNLLGSTTIRIIKVSGLGPLTTLEASTSEVQVTIYAVGNQ